MSSIINTGLDSGLLKFTFTDSDGEVLASFRLNPTDVRLVKRCEEAGKAIDELMKTIPENAGLDEVTRCNEEIEKIFSNVLGYDVSESLFGIISATTILGNGDIFAFRVLERIGEALEPEMKKRRMKMQKAAHKYTKKYHK